MFTKVEAIKRMYLFDTIPKSYCVTFTIESFRLD